MSDGMRALLMALIVALEWWSMQPYHEPVMAWLWNLIMRVARRVAETCGWVALHAEHNYYLAVEAGL